MATLIVQEGTPEARNFLKYAKTLPFIEEQKGKTPKRSFEQAAKACNAVPLSTFTAELHRQINEHFDRLDA